MIRVTLFLGILLFPFCSFRQTDLSKEVGGFLRKDILEQASLAMTQQPVTITAASCERSAGGLHDFYSEGDYWWPDAKNPGGPYIQKDGQSNPDNFTAHRKAMIRFSQIIGTLSSAYLLTKDEKYVNQAIIHLRAWFIDKNTAMNPSLLYAQAIKGKATGRGIGIIDTIQLMEVAQGIRVIEKSGVMDKHELTQIKNWFERYLSWLNTHPYGLEEKEAKNNHGTCWVMQVAVFAKLTGNQPLIDSCKNRFKTVLLPNQLAPNGSFPLELRRTKPYGYSLFNLDAMASICHILSDKQENLWDFKLEDGRTMKKAIEFMFPYVAQKNLWTYPQDVMYWKEWPVAQPFLLFGYQNFGEKKWLETWKKLPHFPEEDEVIRNLPIRNPLIWL
ncbi:Alginate lyase [Pseudarcicella hirudinis]|uniref:Alginate lyase n=1 Tax=Pseudarcicella hirudinis TaxID=1079859 RepID=A0A1I5P9B7_9BACT|nr:alginate lyase family protein [Pseudarcicella hirudinis]SFP30573.1 Alginate lyase [Pseudarcicella hirudinis]